MRLKTVKKVLMYFGILVAMIIGSIAVYLMLLIPNVPLRDDIHINLSEERVARGKYLANHVLVCMDCHSKRDESKFSAPLIEGTEGIGGAIFDKSVGFPGIFISKNITPHGLKYWSDSELYRVITSGVNRSGKAIFPVMPYVYYGQLTDDDIFDVIAYIRSLPTKKSNPGESKADFPVSIILNTIPKPAKPMKKPAKGVSKEYGHYVATAAGCVECHTPAEKGMINQELAYSGGRSFTIASGVIESSNITPDKETGIGSWTKAQFVAKFKGYLLKKDGGKYEAPTVLPGEFNTIMPWTMYAGMDTMDLQAIYTYLQSIKPIKKKTNTFTPNTAIKKPA